MNKLQWNSYQNTKFFIHENAYEKVVCEMTAILSSERWVKSMAMDIYGELLSQILIGGQGPVSLRLKMS